MPSYHLIGTEADELILLGGYRVTLCSLLQRIELTATERAEVYAECG